MRLIFKRRTWKISMCMVISMLFVTINSQASTFVDRKKNVIDTLFEKTKPQCIGRYIIDVPDSFNNSLMNMIFIDDFKIESRPSYRPAFNQRLSRREQELHDAIKKPGNDLKNAPFIKETIRLPDNTGVIFDHNETLSDDSYRILEAHVYYDTVEFIITTEIRDLSAPRYIREKQTYLDAGFAEAETNNKPQKLAMMKSLISRLSGRNDEDIPRDKGLCIPRGFIKDDEAKHVQRVSFTYENDELIFGVKVDSSRTGSGDTLMSRSPQINEAIALSSLRTIKNGELNSGGISIQQWLVSGMQGSNRFKGHFPSYDFILYGNESTASPTKPWIHIGLNNTDKKTQYSESQMVDIWDRLVSSLRYRPGAF